MEGFIHCSVDGSDGKAPSPNTAALVLKAQRWFTVIDEVGYLSFDDKAGDLLHDVVNRRHGRKTVLTTNRPFKKWNEVFPNATCIVTLLSNYPPRKASTTPATEGVLQTTTHSVPPV